MRSADGMLGMSFTPNIYSVMNKAIQTLAALLLVSGSIFGQSVRINAPSSSIRWDGGNALGKMHNGNIAVTSGELEFQSGALVGGSFTIDMNSMTNADLPETVGANLMGHLKSADFFDVEKFPTAKLEIKSATPFQGGKSTVNAEATIKGETKPVNFEVVELNGRYDAVLVIDRAAFNVRYGSGSFFDNLGDEAILDEITLTVHLETK